MSIEASVAILINPHIPRFKALKEDGHSKTHLLLLETFVQATFCASYQPSSRILTFRCVRFDHRADFVDFVGTMVSELLKGGAVQRKGNTG